MAKSRQGADGIDSELHPPAHTPQGELLSALSIGQF
jgi:hypothetical protein